MYLKATICVLLDIAPVSGGETGEGVKGGGRGGLWEYAVERDFVAPAMRTNVYLCAQTYIYAHKRINHTHVVNLMCFWVLYVYVCHDSFICGPWLIHANTCRLSHVYLVRVSVCGGHDTLVCVPWLIYTRDMTHSYEHMFLVWCVSWSYTCICVLIHQCACHDSFTSGTWLIAKWDMTHIYTFSWHTLVYLCHDTLMCVPWLINKWTWLIAKWDMTHIYHFLDLTRLPHLMCDVISYLDLGHDTLNVCHESFTCGTWLIWTHWLQFWCVSRSRIYMWVMTREYVCHDSFICETWLVHTWDVTHINTFPSIDVFRDLSWGGYG